MLIQFFRKILCAVTLLKVGAVKVFLDQLRRQIYKRDVQIGLVRSLNNNYDRDQIQCPVEYNLQEASKEDMDEAFRKVKTESKGSAQLLLNRRWLYECGCGKWFTARTIDTGELCFFQCVISPADNKLLDHGFKNWFPELKEGEMIMEAAYTFEKFRGTKVARSIMFDILDMYRSQGFKRMILYIDKDFEYLLKKSESTGFTKFEEVTLIRTLFFSKRKSRPY
jgi:hypothetical protein